jgi:hypothetical protein
MSSPPKKIWLVTPLTLICLALLFYSAEIQDLLVHHIIILFLQKFICTTVRPTLLPYKEIYDYDRCAQFVADYITFDVLDPIIDLVSFNYKIISFFKNFNPVMHDGNKIICSQLGPKVFDRDLISI